MKRSRGSNYFFAAVLIIASLLALWIFLPFSTPLILAMALAVIFAPLNRWIEKKFFGGKKSSTLAALITLIFIFIAVIVPLTFIAGTLYFEIANLYGYLRDQNNLTEFVPLLSQYLPVQFFEEFDFSNVVSKILEWFLSNLTTLFSNLAWFAMSTFVMFFGLFYFLKEGHAIRNHIISFSPLDKNENKALTGKVQSAIYSIFGGSIVVALIQGILTGIGLALFGVPGSVLWGSVATLTALIPGVGTVPVLLPAILYLFFRSSIWFTLGLLIWGALVIGLIDNFLRPILMAPGMRVHPFPVFLAVLGGLTVFGPIGLLIGPLVLALLIALLQIYKSSRELLA